MKKQIWDRIPNVPETPEDVERMMNLQEAQTEEAKKTPLCTHGVSMDKRCPECDKWLSDHFNRERQNPRRA